MGEFLRRLLYLLTQRRRDRELLEELAAHREMMGEISPREALANFGDDLRLREDAREAWGWMWLDRLRQDLIYAARVLRRSPSFTIAAVLILALGIGVNLAAFHLLNVIAFKPLPVRDPDSIIRLEPRTSWSYSSSLPYPALEFYAQHNPTLSAVLGATFGDLAFGPDGAERVRVRFVTPNFFSELGSGPAYGRVLSPTSDITGAEPVAVLGYGFWKRRFGGDPSIVGSAIRLNDKPVVVAGVAAHDFVGLRPDEIDVWLPIASHPYLVQGSKLYTDLSAGTMQMWARLRLGVSPEQAEESLKPLVAEMRRRHPEHFKEGEYLDASPGAYVADITYKQVPVLLVIALLVLLILVVACANLGNLMLARAVSREREISIRLALGAARARIVRQLVTESFLLALLGATAGTAMSAAMVRVVIALLEIPPYFQFAFDWRVFLAGLALSVLATMLFGLTPALAATRPGHRAPRARRVLIAAQVAASCILLVVGGLMLRSLHQAFAAPPGYDYERIIWLQPALSSHGYRSAEAHRYMMDLRDRILKISGVESIALCSTVPMGNAVGTENGPEFPDVRPMSNRVDHGYFATMRIPLLAGRNFTEGERDAIIVSASLARKLWPEHDPLGKQFLGSPVVGVAGDARVVAQGDPESLQVYRPLGRDFLYVTVLIRTSGAPDATAEALRAATRTIDARVIPQVTLMRDAYRLRMQSSGRGAMVISAMGLLATFLAASGVYGLVCYAVVQRQREIGIRMALGARDRDVLGLMLRQFYVPVAIGVVIGLAGASALSVILRSLLFGISGLDPIAYVAAVAFFMLLAGIAALIPARRALRVNPMDVLRQE